MTSINDFQLTDFSQDFEEPSEIYETRLLFINSLERQNPSDSADSSTFLIAPDLLQAKNNEDELKITLVDFYCPYEWYDITTENNYFVITNTSTNASYSYFIPIGNPDISSIVKSLSSQNNGVVKFAFDKCTSKISMVATGTYLISSLTTKAYLVLGFGHALATFTNTFTAPNIVRVNRLTSIYIRLPDIAHHENIEGGFFGNRFSQSNILAKVPVNARPFADVHFQASANNYNFKMKQSNLNILRIELTDYDGNKIGLPVGSEFNLTLKIEFLRFPAVPLYYRSLNELNENLKLLLLQNDNIINKNN